MSSAVSDAEAAKPSPGGLSRSSERICSSCPASGVPVDAGQPGGHPLARAAGPGPSGTGGSRSPGASATRSPPRPPDRRRRKRRPGGDHHRSSPVSAVHSSSVTNGMTGCSSRSSWSRTKPSTCLVVSAAAASAGGQRHLGQLQVPVADLVPGEVVQRVAGLAELELLEQPVHLGDHRRQPGQDPAVRRGVGGRRGRGGAARARRSSGRSGWRSRACCRSCASRPPTPR